jgi:hypothetical protein
MSSILSGLKVDFTAHRDTNHFDSIENSEELNGLAGQERRQYMGKDFRLTSARWIAAVSHSMAEPANIGGFSK